MYARKSAVIQIPPGDECVSLVTSPTPFETATWLIPNQTDLWLNSSRWAYLSAGLWGVNQCQAFPTDLSLENTRCPRCHNRERGSETSIESLLWWAIRLGILSWCQISINPSVSGNDSLKRWYRYSHTWRDGLNKEGMRRVYQVSVMQWQMAMCCN